MGELDDEGVKGGTERGEGVGGSEGAKGEKRLACLSAKSFGEPAHTSEATQVEEKRTSLHGDLITQHPSSNITSVGFLQW